MGLRFALVLVLGLSFAPGAWAEGEGETVANPEPHRKPNEVSLVVKVPDSVRETLTPPQLALLETLETQLARELTFYSGFDIEVPRPTLADGAQLLSLEPFFLIDAREHVRRLAYDDQGKRRKLTDDQLEQFRVESKYAVEDPQNPGQFDVWQVTSQLAHKGSKQITIELQESLAKGIEHVIIKLPRELWGHNNHSVLGKMVNVVYGIRNSISLLVGLTEETPKYTPTDVEALVQKNRHDWVKDAMKFEGDPRMADEETLGKAIPILERLWKENEKEWPAKIQAARRSIEISPEFIGLPLASRPQMFVNLLAAKKQQLYFDKIAGNQELDALATLPVAGSKPFSQVLLNHAKALVILEATRRVVREEVNAFQTTLELKVKDEHRILGRIPEWYAAVIKEETEGYYADILPVRFGMTADAMENAGLKEEAQRLRHSLVFLRERESDMREDLADVKQAARKFEHFVRIWSAKNWVTRQVTKADGTTEWVGSDLAKLPDVYTDVAGWRLLNFGLRSWSTFWDGIFFIGYSNLWNGPYGVRALFSTEPFATVYMVDPKTGRIIPNDTYKKQVTLAARLDAVAADIQAKHDAFEARPDTGMIPKSAIRPFYLFWNDYVRTALQPLALRAWQYSATAINAVASGSLIAASPLWSLGIPTLGAGINANIWDFDAPRNNHIVANDLSKKKDTGLLLPVWDQLILRSGLRGLVPAALVGIKAALLDAILQPIRYFAGGGTKWTAETVRDWGIRQVLWLLGANRVPAADPDLLMRRVEGPGVSGSYFFQLSPKDAFNTMRLRLELVELHAYQAEVEHLLSLPITKLREFFKPVVLLAGGTGYAGAESLVGKDIYAFVNAKKKELGDQVAAREKELLKLLPTNQAPVRLSEKDLEFVVSYGAQSAQAYLELLVLSRLDKAQTDAFWNTHQLTAGDWIGLSKKLLTASFGNDILVPMEATDKGFKVKVAPNGVFESVEDLYAGGSGFPDPATLPEWSARAPVDPKVTMPTFEPGMLCSQALASYGQGLRTIEDIRKP